MLGIEIFQFAGEVEGEHRVGPGDQLHGPRQEEGH